MTRGSSEKIIVDGTTARRPCGFKAFLANDDNKKQLCHLSLRVWRDKDAASRLAKTKMAVLIVEGTAYQLVSSNNQMINLCDLSCELKVIV